MFNLFSDLRALAVRTSDGKEGSVDDLYFDDRDWALRYVVADVGGFLFGHKVLLGTDVIGRPDLDKGEWPVEAGQGEIESAPSPEANSPVSEQHGGRLYWGDDPYPPLMLGPSGAAYTPFMAEYQLGQLHRERQHTARHEKEGDPHLRSMDGVRGYSVSAEGGDRIGSVADFLVNPVDWSVRYVVVDTGDWLPGRKIVLPVDSIEAVIWERGEVETELTRHQIESSPEPADISGLREAEDKSLLRHFGL